MLPSKPNQKTCLPAMNSNNLSLKIFSYFEFKGGFLTLRSLSRKNKEVSTFLEKHTSDFMNKWYRLRENVGTLMGEWLEWDFPPLPVDIEASALQGLGKDAREKLLVKKLTMDLNIDFLPTCFPGEDSKNSLKELSFSGL